jgi:hypothetical protein
MKNLYILLLIGFFTTSSSAQCFDNGHSPFEEQGWLSCEMNLSPNPDRGETHWILYDLGHRYTINETYIWNHNVWGETGMGANQILIDYSDDMEEWKTIGPYTIEKAPGSWKYTGIEGPTLDNVIGQYFLITVLNTHDQSSSCAGLGEIKLIIGESVDTEDPIEDQDFTIAPNPASEQIRITLTDYAKINSINIYNTVGQNVTTLNIPTGNEMTIPLDGYSNGLYHVSINSSDGIKTKSFIKVDGQ